MKTADYCEMQTPHLIDYIAGYIVSGEHISEKIEAMIQKNDARQNTAATESTVAQEAITETAAVTPAIAAAPTPQEDAEEEKKKKGQVERKIAVELVLALLKAAGMDTNATPKSARINTAKLIHALTGYSIDKLKKDITNAGKNLTDHHSEETTYINELLENLGLEIRLACSKPKK